MTDAMLIGLAGRGALADRMAAALRLRYRVTQLESDVCDARVELGGAAVLLCVGDGADLDARARWSSRSIALGIPLLAVHLEPGAAIVGPCVLPGEPGCLSCADARMQRARHDGAQHAALQERHGPRFSELGAGWLTPFAECVLSDLVAERVARVLADPGAVDLRRGFIRVSLGGLRTSRHAFLPDPLCEHCGRLPDDERDAAVLRLESRRKLTPRSYRVRTLLPEKAALQARYVDEQAGMVRGVYKEGRAVFPSASAALGLRDGHRSERGYGHQLSYEASQVTAIVEALERHAGIEPGGKRTVVRGSHRELAADALDPLCLGLHTEAQHAAPGFPYVRYERDLRFNWVWGHSFARQRPILVPENYAYYGSMYRPGRDRPFVYEISNGCALGGCLEEAILHGMFEVAERDAFLLTWYARLPVRRIDPRSARDRSLPLIVDAIERATGLGIWAFDTTLGGPIPCFWVMAVNERGLPDKPMALCAAGANANPEKALTNALLELAPMTCRPAEYYARNRARVERMLADPDQVMGMEDHALLNAAPEAFERFDFLGPGRAPRAFEDAFASYYASAPSDDLLDDLNAAAERYLAAGHDIIVVDQTTPEQRLGGFRCVKVIIVGMLPMTFGHGRRRTHGLSRLLTRPFEIGHAPRPLREPELNPHPHPFP